MRALFSLFFFLSLSISSVHAAEDIYQIEQTYIEPEITLGYRYVIDTQRGLAFSITITNGMRVIREFQKDDSGDYVFVRDTETNTANYPGEMFIQNDTLVILYNDESHFYSIDIDLGLSFISSSALVGKPSGTNLTGRLVKVGATRYIVNTYDTLYLIDIDTVSRALTLLDYYVYHGADENVSQTVVEMQYQSDTQELWLFKNTDDRYRFGSVSITDNGMQPVVEYSYTFPEDFDEVNEAGIIYAHINIDYSKVYVRSNRRSFIFELNTTEITTQLVANELVTTDNFLDGQALSANHLISREGMMYLGQLDWSTNQIQYSDMGTTVGYSEYKFVTDSLILAQSAFGNGAQLFEFVDNQLVDNQQFFTSELSGTFPDWMSDSHYHTNNQWIIMLGRDRIERENYKLYLWQYTSADQSAQPLTQADVITTETAGFYNHHIIGAVGNFIYVLVKSNLTITSEVIVYEYRGTSLQEVQRMSLNGGEQFAVLEFGLLNDNTLYFFPYIEAGNTFYMNICSLNELGQVSGCVDTTLFDGQPINEDSSRFSMKYLTGSDYLLFAPKRNILVSQIDNLSAQLLSYDLDGQSFVSELNINLPARDLSYLSLDTAFLFDEGTRLYIRFEETFIYKKNPETNQWELEKTEFHNSYPNNPMATSNPDYYINQDGAAYLADDVSFQFFKSQQRRNIGYSNSIYRMTEGNQGYLIQVGEESILTTFSLIDTEPLYYKGSLLLTNQEAIQDQELIVDFRSFFINLGYDDLELLIDTIPFAEFGHPRMTWDGQVFSATLNNEDMFRDGQCPTPANDYFVRVDLGSSSLGSFRLTPVNVNDPPELTQSIPTQNLELGQAYSGELIYYVNDPDCDNLSFTYTNVPDGMSADENGVITGSINTVGNYIMNVIATDTSGESVSFEINITVSAPPPPPTTNPGSGGGGGSTDVLWFLSLLGLYFVRTRRDFYFKNLS